MIEGQTGDLLVATNLNRRGVQGRVIVRCMNLANQPVRLKAGSTKSPFTGMEEGQVEDQYLTDCEVSDTEPSSEPGENNVPEHLEQLYVANMGSCEELV